MAKRFFLYRYKADSFQQLIWLVLALFALTIAVSIASPLVKSKPFDLICTGSGMVKQVNVDTDDQSDAHLLDCPACLPNIWSLSNLIFDFQAHHLSDVWAMRPWSSAYLPSLFQPYSLRGPPAYSI